jgi:site-specific DNA-cytosine methylase
MKILVACEESQAVTKAFRALGNEAYSCDIESCSGGHPEWHLQQDVTELLKQTWDMVIAFPPCTHLAVSGAAWFKQKREDGRQQQAIDFFMMFTKIACPWCIENPVGIMSKIYRKPDQKIQPYNFGDPYQKTTCLWLNKLPLLSATHHDLPLFGEKTERGIFKKYADGTTRAAWFNSVWGDKEGKKFRSKTFEGIAQAMANQWGITDKGSA